MMAKLTAVLALSVTFLASASSSRPADSETATSAPLSSRPHAGHKDVHQKRPLGQELVSPGALYSPGVLIGRTIYVAGLQGTDQETHQLPQDFAQEVKNCLNNVGLVLNDGGMRYDDVVSIQIYLVDISQFEQVNAIYQKYFKSPLPARTTVQVAKLSLGSRIEISAIARR